MCDGGLVCHPRVSGAKGPASSLSRFGILRAPGKDRRARMTEGRFAKVTNEEGAAVG
jgi:hypothetical protein